MPARYVKEVIEQIHLCDFRPRLNTSSYVNVVSEPEEREVAIAWCRSESCGCKYSVFK